MVQFEGVFPLKSSHLTGNTSFQANGTLCLDWKPGFSCANLKLGLIIKVKVLSFYLSSFLVISLWIHNFEDRGRVQSWC